MLCCRSQHRQHPEVRESHHVVHCQTACEPCFVPVLLFMSSGIDGTVFVLRRSFNVGANLDLDVPQVNHHLTDQLMLQNRPCCC